MKMEPQVGRCEKSKSSRIVVQKKFRQGSEKCQNKCDSDKLMHSHNRLRVEAQDFSGYLRFAARKAHSSQTHSAFQNQKSTRQITRLF